MAESKNSKPQTGDRRPASRQRVLLPGLIVHGSGAYTCDCTFRSLSAQGARIILGQRLPFPDQFHLINIRDGTAYDARIAWKKGLEIGVKFQATIALSGKCDLAFHRLRRLWLAKAAF
jgi:hypothetical protein